jgi:hypothetical protein
MDCAVLCHVRARVVVSASVTGPERAAARRARLGMGAAAVGGMRPALLLSLLGATVVAACGGSSGSGVLGPPSNEDADPGDASTRETRSPLCPTSKPEGGTGCPSVGLTCRFPSACASPILATCSAAGTWGVAIPDCATQCPSAKPAAASSCPVAKLACDYGEDPRPWCRDRASCFSADGGSSGTWSISKTANAIGAIDCKNPQVCPASAPLTDDRCTAWALCTFGGQSCACEDRNAGCGACETTNFRWTCTPLPPAPCPTTLPNLGTACAVDGSTCNYGKCGTASAASFTCTSGAWITGPPCR